MRTFSLLALVLLSTACKTSQVCPPASEPISPAATANSAAEPSTNAAGSTAAVAAPSASAAKPMVTVVLKSEAKWEQLNPARGDKSPMAATLWGDRHGKGPTGFLFHSVDGFKSPPHVHNVSYRGMVIGGVIHNDDTHAAEMWMPPGSFWTQPKGGVHLTAAKGDDVLAYIEIEEGPYLVYPVDKAFQSGEVPVNVDASNIVWLDASNSDWIDQGGAVSAANGPKIAFLWGRPQGDQLNGTLVQLPKGFSGKIRSQGSELRAVVIRGSARYAMPDGAEVKTLEPGSYFSSQGPAEHPLSCETKEACVIYIRMKGELRVTAARPEK